MTYKMIIETLINHIPEIFFLKTQFLKGVKALALFRSITSAQIPQLCLDLNIC